jgi:hypothetical protein
LDSSAAQAHSRHSGVKDPVEDNFPELIVMKSGFIHSPFEKKRSVPLFEKDDCTDAGAITEGLGEIYQTNPPRSPFFKGGGVVDETLFSKGRCFLTKP